MPLKNVAIYTVEGICECLVSVRDVAEVALDPVSFRRNVEAKSLRVSDLCGLVWVT